MSPPSSSSKRNRKRSASRETRDRAAITFALALVFLIGMIWDGIESHYAALITAAIQPGSDPDSVVLSFAAAGLLAKADDETASPDEVESQPESADTCIAANVAALSRIELPAVTDDPVSFSIAPRTHSDIMELIRVASADTGKGGVGLISFARKKVLPKFAPAYRSVLKLAAFMGLPRLQREAAYSRTTIMGTVSTYNPYRDGIEEGGPQTASGELYDPAAWTAAIQVDLREQFGGVRYGSLTNPLSRWLKAAKSRSS